MTQSSKVTQNNKLHNTKQKQKQKLHGKKYHRVKDKCQTGRMYLDIYENL